ncbi:MAG: L,D-transpeptidase family protein, partial [Elusimicrobia bacterium]|nr:L,D-transpeptidase family protein [Elusimicrobiota bacterium]
KRLPAVIGRKGMAWGIGLHPSGMAGPQKKEGDFKTPAGVFSLGRGYGYEGAGPQGSGWPYQEASERLRCVDDPKSKQYNLVVEETKDKDWNSAEIMRRNDEQYQWVIVVRHNDGEAGPVSGMGSCIFFHVWKDRSSSTAGCTALKAKHIELIFKWLDPALSPVAVHLPKEVYQDAQGIWNLPDLD